MKSEISGRWPAVTRLGLHIEDDHLVYFAENEDLRRVLETGRRSRTTLTEFFCICRENVMIPGTQLSARTLRYPEVTNHFWFDRRSKTLKPRKNDMPSVGQVYFATLKNGERYYLRLLLTHVVGPISFQSLRTVNVIEYSTYREAANRLGLLIGDQHNDASLQEAAVWQTGNQLRHMFAIILKESPPSDPQKLWEDHCENLSDDCLQRLQRRRPHLDLTDEQLHNYALSLLETVLTRMDRSLEDVGMPKVNILMLDSSGISAEDLDQPVPLTAARSAERVLAVLEHANPEQAEVFKNIANALAQGTPAMFFLDGVELLKSSKPIGRALRGSYTANRSQL